MILFPRAKKDDAVTLTVADVAGYIENELAPISEALEGDENGLLYGSLEEEVKGIAVSWSPAINVIKKAAWKGHNLVVSHEWLFYHHSNSRWVQAEKKEEDKIPNRRRKKILDSADISVLKYHTNWDFAPGGVLDSFGEYLDFPTSCGGNRFTRLHEIEPVKLGGLAARVLDRLNCGAVRISGDREKVVRRVLTAVGGLGQMFGVADDFLSLEPDVVIFGETLEYTGIYTEECGIPYMVTSHYHSERPGMIKMADKLRKRFGSVPVEYYESFENWTVLS